MENKIMNNRVFGLLGVYAENSKFNADFSGKPRSLPNGDYYATDKVLKYAIRNYFKLRGDLVFNFRSDYFKEDSKTGLFELVPRTLKENYDNLFGVGKEVEVNSKAKKAKKESKRDVKEIVTNLFSCIDIKQFGATYAEGDNAVSIKGAVQIYQGVNIYEEAMEEFQTILSPYKNSNEDSDNNTATTIGNQVILDEAHYIYPFSINPMEYAKWSNLGVIDGYMEEDYAKLKEAMNKGVTALSSCTKVGCENEYSIYVKIKENEVVYLPNLARYVQYTKTDKVRGTLTLGFGDMLDGLKDKIESVEVYYNPYSLDIDFKGVENLNCVKYMDIVTNKEIVK